MELRTGIEADALSYKRNNNNNNNVSINNNNNSINNINNNNINNNNINNNNINNNINNNNINNNNNNVNNNNNNINNNNNNSNNNNNNNNFNRDTQPSELNTSRGEPSEKRKVDVDTRRGSGADFWRGGNPEKRRGSEIIRTEMDVRRGSVLDVRRGSANELRRGSTAAPPTDVKHGLKLLLKKDNYNIDMMQKELENWQNQYYAPNNNNNTNNNINNNNLNYNNLNNNNLNNNSINNNNNPTDYNKTNPININYTTNTQSTSPSLLHQHVMKWISEVKHEIVSESDEQEEGAGREEGENIEAKSSPFRDRRANFNTEQEIWKNNFDATMDFHHNTLTQEMEELKRSLDIP